MTHRGWPRRRILAVAAIAGSLAGCSELFEGDSDGDGTSSPTGGEDWTSPPTTERTDSPTSQPMESSTPEPTDTPTSGPEAAVEVTDATLRAETITVGEPIEVEVSLSNTGGADGAAELSLGVDGENVRTERFGVPAGEEVQTVLTGHPTPRTGTVTVTIDGRTVGEVAVAPPDVLHVAPDGDDADPGTENAPLSSIADAVDRARPGQTVQVHPGEYFEYVEFTTPGEPEAPVTLTGPPEAVLKPPEDVDHQAISVGASHVHITGLTITGLYEPDAPGDPESYHSGKLIDLNTFAADDDDYIEGLVVSPHGIGGAGGALINSVRIEDCEIGGFEVVGPAGTNWILDDSKGHYGEIVYLGTAPGNVAKRDGFDEYDRTRNVRVHHIDNSAGHPHSEMVDCKAGVENVTIEYCTDGGGAQTHEGPYQRSISLDGRGCTVRWNVVQNVEGDGVRIGPQGFLGDPGTLGEPETDLERRMGTDHAIYGNVFTGNTHDAIDFLRESEHPGRDSNPLPEDQRALCGNLFDGYSDDAPGKSCSSDLPSGDGVGHLGGDSPWKGDAPTKREIFARHATAKNLDATIDADDVPTNTEIEATVTVTNRGESPQEVVFRLRVHEHVLATETVSIPPGETREVRLTEGGLPDPEAVSITRNGQKIGHVRVTDEG